MYIILLKELEKLEKLENQKFMWTAKVGDKGQIVIPKEAREVFNIKTGDTLLLLGDTQRGLAIVDNSQYLKFAQSIFDAQNGGNQ